MTVHVTQADTGRLAFLRVDGDLDYENADELVDLATGIIAEHTDLVDLHIDLSELTSLDSAALAGLLLIQRRTSQLGIALHLDHRPDFVERLLALTCTADIFATDIGNRSGLRYEDQA